MADFPGVPVGEWAPIEARVGRGWVPVSRYQTGGCGGDPSGGGRNSFLISGFVDRGVTSAPNVKTAAPVAVPLAFPTIW